MDKNLDEKDWQIIEALKEKGNATTRQIAKKTLLPATTIHNRIRKLEEEKVIKKYTIELDPKKAGRNFLAYVLVTANLGILKQKHRTQYDMAREISKFADVETVNIVSGGADLIAIIRVKDVEAFDKLLLGKLQFIDGVEKTQSLIVIH